MKATLKTAILLLSIQFCIAQSSKDSFYFKKISEPGVRFISVYNGKYKVFTQKVGEGKIKLLLLHGGPVNTHEYFENFPFHLRNNDIEIYYYDQLGSYYSDQPNDTSIWNANCINFTQLRFGLKNHQQAVNVGEKFSDDLAKSSQISIKWYDNNLKKS
jgi:proline iminopeptidase